MARGAESGEEVLERLDLREVGVAAEVQIRQVDDEMTGAVIGTSRVTLSEAKGHA